MASGSSRMRVGARASGCCRWRSRGWPRSAIAGAFGADGESSDGAGVALPLDRSLLRAARRRCAPTDRPGIVSLFLPRGRRRERRARALVEATFAGAGLPVVAWRPVPVDAAALGAAAAASRPAFAHAIVAARPAAPDDPRPLSDDAFERRLVVARRRLETAARAAGGALAELSVPSASARTIVYKGLVIGGRLAELYPDLRAAAVASATRSSTSATRRTPTRSGGSPSRSGSIAHNGEINTVRGNRDQVRGRAGDAATSRRSPRRSSRPARCCRPTAPTRCRSTRRSSC